MALSRVLLLLILLAAGSSVDGTTYSSFSCSSKCQFSSDFIQPLPSGSGPVSSANNRAYAWSVLALIQLQLNLDDLSPPAAGRVVGLVSACLYEAVALTSSNYNSAFGNPPLDDVGVDADVTLDQVMDGAAYWALRALFEDAFTFSRVESQYSGFSGESVDYLMTAANIAAITGSGALPEGLSDGEAFKLLGARACNKVVEKFTEDGYAANGNLTPGSDRTDYFPTNFHQRLAGITNCGFEMRDKDRWQPLCTPTDNDDYGTPFCVQQSFLHPWAGRYTPFALQAGDEYTGGSLVGPPPSYGTTEFNIQADEVLQISANLDDVQKIIAEYWADGPDTTAPPGHLYKMAADAAKDEFLSTPETAKLLFMVGMAVYDAGIASWRTKTTYDFLRPLQMIQCGEHKGEDVPSWLGPYRGVGTMKADEWRPYQDFDFVTPPFAAYTSGHSTFSAAGAEALRLYFGDDSYRGPPCFLVREGESLFEPQSSRYPGVSDIPNTGFDTEGYVPADDVVLCWDTYTDAADEAGLSRLYGGIHIRADDTSGQSLGRSVGYAAYLKIEALSN